MCTAIEIENLTHSFSEKTILDNINLSVKKGEIFGLLGPSGAGKTTLINILTGQLTPTGGDCSIFGVSSAAMSGEHYKQIGIMMDTFGLYERMSCYDNLKFYQMLDSTSHKISHEKYKQNLRRNARENAAKNSNRNTDTNIAGLLDDVGLLSAKKTLVMNLSKGMKNRLAFARALLRTPEILFLDEPTSGLDPTTTESIHKMILAEKQRGTTIFLTTHNMYEAEKLCDNIALLNNGKIVEFGAPDDICRRYNHQRKINIRLKNGEDIVLEHSKACAEKVKLYFLNEEIETIHSTEPNLETIFMELTGRRFEV